jgi:hypothetical protein
MFISGLIRSLAESPCRQSPFLNIFIFYMQGVSRRTSSSSQIILLCLFSRHSYLIISDGNLTFVCGYILIVASSIVVCGTIMSSRVPVTNEVCPTCGSSVRDGTNCPGCHKVAQIAVLRATINALENSTEEEPYPAHTYDSVVNNTTAGPALSSILLSGASSLQLGQVSSTRDKERTDEQPSFISGDADYSRSCSGTVTSFSTSVMSRLKPLAGAGSEARQHGLNLVQRWGLAGDNTVLPVSAMSQEDVSKLMALVPKDFLAETCDHEAILTKKSFLRDTFTTSPNFASSLEHFKYDVSVVGKRFREFVRLSMKNALLNTASRCLQESGYKSITPMRSIEDMSIDLKRGPIRDDGSLDANWNKWFEQLYASHITTYSRTGGENLLILSARSMEAMGIAYCQDDAAFVRPNRSLGSFKAVATKIYGNVKEWLRNFATDGFKVSSIKQGPRAVAANATEPVTSKVPVGGFPFEFPEGGFPLLAVKTELSCGWEEMDGGRARNVDDRDSLFFMGDDMTAQVPGAIDVLGYSKKPEAVDAIEEEVHRMPVKFSVATPVSTSTNLMQQTAASAIMNEGTSSNAPVASTRKISMVVRAPPAKTKVANDIKTEPAPGVGKAAADQAKAAAKTLATKDRAKAAALQKLAYEAKADPKGAAMSTHDSEPPKGVSVDKQKPTVLEKVQVKDVSVAQHNEQVEVPTPTALTKAKVQAAPVMNEKQVDTASEKLRASLQQKVVKEQVKPKLPDVEVINVPVPVPVEVQVEVQVDDGRRICGNPTDHVIYQAGQYKSETNGAYSFVDGVACEVCLKEGTSVAGKGTNYICPTKADPVWVCATCEGNLHCSHCFRLKQKQFDLDNPNGCKRSRVRKRKSH